MMVIIYTVNTKNYIVVCAWSVNEQNHQNHLYISPIALHYHIVVYYDLIISMIP